eukprot:104029_1
MALTGYVEDSTSDDEGKVEMPQQEVNRGIGLIPFNIREKDTVEKVQECNHLNKDDDSETKTEVPSEVGAGLLFGFSGLLLGGPILALLAGVGATCIAANDEGPVGEAARASGDAAITAGTKAGEAAKDANEKHGILDKIKDAFNFGWGKVQQFDEDHNATEKVKGAVSGVAQKTVEMEQKHHVMENVLQGIQNGVNFLMVKLKDATDGSCNNSNTSKS